MEKLADKGDGNYAYIDNILEAKKVLVNELGSTLYTIAKDVKIQVEFNPAKVQAYRLIGYENRILAAKDFNNDKKDAGELGAGHSVTAIYEIIPTGVKSELWDVDPLKYQKTKAKITGTSDEILTIKFRYKPLHSNKSKLIEKILKSKHVTLSHASNNFKFSAAVASFGMLLRNSEYKGSSSFNDVLAMARNSKGKDNFGYRAEFIRMVEQAQLLSPKIISEVINN